MSKTFVFSVSIILTCFGCMSLPPQTNFGPTVNSVQAPVSTAIKPPLNFAPTYQSELADKYHEAIEIYDSSPKATTGLFLFDGLAFIIVEIDTQKEDIEYLEGTAMLRAVALLRKHYPQLPAKFRIRNRVVEKVLDDETGMYRYALAYRVSDIQKAINSEANR